MIRIHPSAHRNFDEKAHDLLSLLEKEVPEEQHGNEFKSEKVVTLKLTDEDMTGEPDVWKVDHTGTPIARSLFSGGAWYVLGGDSYSKVQALVEGIQKTSNLRQQVSARFVEDCLFAWLRIQLTSETAPASFVEYLVGRVTKVIDHLMVWVPVANLEIEDGFKLGNVTIVPLNRDWFDGWESRLADKAKDAEHAEYLKQYFEKLRKELQGFAAVVLEMEAEPNHAETVSLQESKKALDMLAIFSQAIRVPNLRCGVKAKGSECIRESISILTRDEPDFVEKRRIRDNPAGIFWTLNVQQIKKIDKLGLGAISVLLAKEQPSDFERNILSSLSIYAKAAFTSDPAEKLVLVLSSLESILIRNQTEPLQQSLAERIAVFIAKELESRKDVIRKVKDAYGLRSRYLHHGYSPNQLSLVSEILRIAWIFYLNLLKNSTRFSNRDDFVSAIDDYKLG